MMKLRPATKKDLNNKGTTFLARYKHRNPFICFVSDKEGILISNGDYHQFTDLHEILVIEHKLMFSELNYGDSFKYFGEVYTKINMYIWDVSYTDDTTGEPKYFYYSNDNYTVFGSKDDIEVELVSK